MNLYMVEVVVDDKADKDSIYNWDTSFLVVATSKSEARAVCRREAIDWYGEYMGQHMYEQYYSVRVGKAYEVDMSSPGVIQVNGQG